MRKIITYAVDESTGLIVSRCGDELAWPVLDYAAMTPENNYTASYYLEKMPVSSLGHAWAYLHWTRKIPTDIKNVHRQFCGMSLLPLANPS